MTLYEMVLLLIEIEDHLYFQDVAGEDRSKEIKELVGHLLGHLQEDLFLERQEWWNG
jgi:hypothetical protein